jgi:hypothetical protein
MYFFIDFGNPQFLLFAVLSIPNSRFGILCFSGVVNSLAAKSVASFGEIACKSLAVPVIAFGICND